MRTLFCFICINFINTIFLALINKSKLRLFETILVIWHLNWFLNQMAEFGITLLTNLD